MSARNEGVDVLAAIRKAAPKTRTRGDGRLVATGDTRINAASMLRRARCRGEVIRITRHPAANVYEFRSGSVITCRLARVVLDAAAPTPEPQR